MSNKLSFKTSIKFMEVEIDGKDYKLHGLTGAQRAEHLTSQNSNMRFSPKGDLLGMKNFSGFESNLVALSLRDSEGKPISVSIIESWPADVVTTLATEVRKMSGMATPENPEPVETAKNDSEASA
jgi:hypothetical protein